MKHIKRKLQFDVSADDESGKNVVNISRPIDLTAIKKQKPEPGETAFIGTDAGRLIRAFHYKHQGTDYFIPEPDPVLIYFNAAYWSLKSVHDLKPKLFKALDKMAIGSEVTHELYSFYSACASFVTNLFCATEAFLNKSIPEDYEYVCDEKKYLKVYNRTQVLETIDFKTKLLTIIKDVSNGKDYSKSPNTQRILNLKELRDAIIHTKMSSEEDSTYKHIFKKCLDFKYAESLEAVKCYINFYSSDSNYIEECDCGKDF